MAPVTMRLHDIYEATREPEPEAPPKPRYVVGLDLGKSMDYTAVAILEVHGEVPEATYHCRHLQRFKLGTSYPHIVESVREICRREPLLSSKPTLAVDQTGVGNAVVDIFKQAKLNADLQPILIHGGDNAVREDGVWRVPKRELVGSTQVALQTGRLRSQRNCRKSRYSRRRCKLFRWEFHRAVSTLTTHAPAHMTTWFWRWRWHCGWPTAHQDGFFTLER